MSMENHYNWKPGATGGAGTAYASGAHECIPSFCWVRVAQSFAFCVVFVDHSLSFYLDYIVFFDLTIMISSHFSLLKNKQTEDRL